MRIVDLLHQQVTLAGVAYEIVAVASTKPRQAHEHKALRLSLKEVRGRLEVSDEPPSREP